MWLLEFLFFTMTLLLGWMAFGYLILLWFMGLFRRKKTPQFPAIWPMISVVVPCYNEEDQIVDKLENLRELDYPPNCLEVVFADGGSGDRTCELLMIEIGKDDPARLVRCPDRGKINQLNHVLPQLRGQIIVNTDADARLDRDALKWMAAEFAVSPDIAVVGAYCYPAETLDTEQYYWSAQNKARMLESQVGSSSIVIAQCYGFRRELLQTFPEDVVADDIYVAYLSNTLGFRTVYSSYVKAVETRTPQNYAEFLPHKFRKSNAFLRESLRFIYRLPEMKPFWKTMLLTRTAQQLLLPLALLWWVLLAGTLLTLFRFDVVIFGTAFLILLFFITNRIFASVKLPGGQHRYPFKTMVKGYILTNVIMLTTGLSYIFFQQGSSYDRLHFTPSNTEEKEK